MTRFTLRSHWNKAASESGWRRAGGGRGNGPKTRMRVRSANPAHPAEISWITVRNPGIPAGDDKHQV